MSQAKALNLLERTPLYGVDIVVIGNQRLDTGCRQSVQIYMGDGCIHGFDRQKVSKAEYIAGNS